MRHDDFLPGMPECPSPPETREERPANPHSDSYEAGPLSVCCNLSDPDVRALHFMPPVVIPPHGHTEVDCHGDTAIVRTFYAGGEVAEVRLQNALVREGDTVKVIQLGGNQA
jgi:hypothetical protein